MLTLAVYFSFHSLNFSQHTPVWNVSFDDVIWWCHYLKWLVEFWNIYTLLCVILSTFLPGQQYDNISGPAHCSVSDVSVISLWLKEMAEFIVRFLAKVKNLGSPPTLLHTFIYPNRHVQDADLQNDADNIP